MGLDVHGLPLGEPCAENEKSWFDKRSEVPGECGNVVGCAADWALGASTDNGKRARTAGATIVSIVTTIATVATISTTIATSTTIVTIVGRAASRTRGGEKAGQGPDQHQY
jgi:hypothetical protein